MSVLDRFKLDGKRALVTGASRGLGLEMALALAEAGADVGITGRDEASLAEAAAALRPRGRQAWTCAAICPSRPNAKRFAKGRLAKSGPSTFSSTMSATAA